MSQRKDSIREHMTQAHVDTWPFLSSLAPSDLETRVYAAQAEGWTVRQVLAHLADAERGLLGQARRVAEGKDGVPADFDRERWNRGAVRRKANVEVPALLHEIQDAHEQGLEFLRDLPEKDLDLSGRSSMGIVLTVEGLLRRIGDHRREHVADIHRALGR